MGNLISKLVRWNGAARVLNRSVSTQTSFSLLGQREDNDSGSGEVDAVATLGPSASASALNQAGIRMHCGSCLKRITKRDSRKMENNSRICKSCYYSYVQERSHDSKTGVECAASPDVNEQYDAGQNVHGFNREKMLSADGVRLLSSKADRVNQSTSCGGSFSEEAECASPETKRIRLSINRCLNNRKKCIICKSSRNSSGRTSLVNIGKEARHQMFLRRGIFVTKGMRCCRSHLSGNCFNQAAVDSCNPELEFVEPESKEIEDLISYLRSLAISKKLDFDTPGCLTDRDYHALTGLTKDSFDNMFSYISGQIRSTRKRSPRTCLAVLLIKLRTGLPHSVLGALFGLSKSRISKSISTVRKLLMFSFVPAHLGTNHISREDFIKQHTSPVAKEIFSPDNDAALLVLDGTYLYIEKSANYSFQKRTYSLHKGRNLIKPMMVVSTTGYILDVFGPYLADSKNNDASILNSLVTSSLAPLRTWLQEDDVFIVDRGFRDSLETLRDLGFQTEMPCFTKSGSQYTTAEANESRLVTKVRWVVEAVNRLIKTWKFLDNVVPNSQIPYAGDYVRIICAMCNAYRPPRIAPSEEDMIEAQRMLRLSKAENHLKQRVEENKWDKKRVIYKVIDDTTCIDFPRLTTEELRWITMGIYQLKQSKSYTAEHMTAEGDYKLSYLKETPTIIRLQLQSRHTSSKAYALWIEYGQSVHPIVGWYCKCQAGARVVGCCAHVASVLWYLGHSRHHQHTPEAINTKAVEAIDDAAATGWTDDSSEHSSSSDDDF